MGTGSIRGITDDEVKEVVKQALEEELARSLGTYFPQEVEGTVYGGVNFEIKDVVKTKNKVVGIGCDTWETDKLFIIEFEDYKKVNVVKVMDIQPWWGATLFYDFIDDNFLLFYGHHTDDLGNHYGMYRLDKDYKVIASQVPLMVDGAELKNLVYAPEVGPLFSLRGVAGHPSYALGVIKDNTIGVEMIYTDDFRGSGIPTFSQATGGLLAQSDLFDGAFGQGGSIDSSTGVMATSVGFVFFVKVHTLKDTGRLLYPCFMRFDVNTGRPVAGISVESPLFLHMLESEDYVYPTCVTNVFGAPVVYLRHYRLGKTYVSPLPTDALDYRRQRVVWHVWIDESISANDTSPPIPGVGKKTVYFKSDTSGDLDIQYDPSGRGDIWMTRLSYTGITEALDEITGSAYTMRLKFSAAAKVSAYVVVEP